MTLAITGCTHVAGEAASGAVESIPGRVEIQDDSWLYDDDDDTTFKKKKSKYGISPKKIIGGIQGIIDPYKKKDKKKKQQGPPLPASIAAREKQADLEHYAAKPQSKSDDWKTFQEMNARIQATVTKTKDNLKEIEGTVEETVQQLNTAAQNSPWAVQSMGPGQRQPGPNITSPPESVPTASKTQPAASWVGFEDSFDSVKHMDMTKHLPHLNVTPIPSPKHTPVPPYNSRRNSQDEETPSDANYLDSTQPAALQGSSTEDLLGLNSDMSALSRNVQLNDDNRSSGAPSPVPLDQDILALGEGPTEGKDDEAEESSAPAGASTIMDDFVDEFLGIKGAEPPPPPAPVQIPNLQSKKEEAEPMLDDDDPFGLGTLGTKKKQTSTTVVRGDLMGGIEEDDIADPFAISDTTKAIAEGTANIEDILSQAQRLKTNVQSPDDFDPRADLGTRAAPVAQDASALWGSAVKACENPFKAEMFETEETAETFCHAESTNPFASALASMNPFAGGEAVDIDVFTTGDAEVMPDVGTFNPFATIHGDGDGESVTAEHDGGFDPFQTIQDDDAFIDIPKMEGAKHEETDAMRPPPPRHRPKPAVGPPPIKITTTSIKPVSRPKVSTTPAAAAETEITAFLPPPPKKADVQVQEESEEEEEEEAKIEKGEAKSSTNPFAATEEDELDPFAVFQRPAVSDNFCNVFFFFS